jgi:transposase
MKFVAVKTVEQLDLQGLHRIRERLVCQRTSVINQIPAFLLERGIAVRQGMRALRTSCGSCAATACRSSQAQWVSRTLVAKNSPPSFSLRPTE